jgi:ubiquinone/menaquinone biosynthesis C-methylase UbiE
MKRRQRRLKLLPANVLVKTGPVDHGEWNFRPILGWIQRLRFRMIQSLLPVRPVTRLLEVGYGSGIFMPTLAESCYELYGIDIHPFHHTVEDRLKVFHIKAELQSGSAEVLPYPSDFFDTVVAVSCLEFIEDIEVAVLELHRVLKPDGHLILVTPGYSPILDWGLKLLTGESAQQDYNDRRQRLLPTLQQFFNIHQKQVFPSVISSFLCLYTALKLSPRPIQIDLQSDESPLLADSTRI